MQTPDINPARRALLLAAAALISGCGFRLRADFTLPPTLERVRISGEDRELAASLSAALTQHGATLTDAADATHIDLTRAQFHRPALTTDSAGRATAYTLRYEVEFRVADRPAQTLALERAYDYHPGRELQAEEETRFLQTDMRHEMARRIMRRLGRL